MPPVLSIIFANFLVDITSLFFYIFYIFIYLFKVNPRIVVGIPLAIRVQFGDCHVAGGRSSVWPAAASAFPCRVSAARPKKTPRVAAGC